MSVPMRLRPKHLSVRQIKARVRLEREEFENRKFFSKGLDNVGFAEPLECIEIVGNVNEPIPTTSDVAAPSVPMAHGHSTVAAPSVPTAPGHSTTTSRRMRRGSGRSNVAVKLMADFGTTSTTCTTSSCLCCSTPPTIQQEPVNMISEIDSPILSTVDEKKIRVAADTGACAHCIGPDDLPDGMMVDQCPQRNFCGPDGKPIEHFGEATMRLQQPGGGHVKLTSQVLGVSRALHSVSMICDKKQDMLFTQDMGYVVPKGVFDEVLKKCRHIAEYPREGGLWVSEMTVKTGQPPGDQPAAPFAGRGRDQ